MAEAAVAVPIATLRPGDYVLWPEYPRCLPAPSRTCRPSPKGANPAEMPIEQVMRLDFIINLRTARTRGEHPTHPARPRRRGDRMKEGARQSWRDQPVKVRPR